MPDPLQVLAQGGVVAIATESFFGLLADVTQSIAVDRLIALKPRGSDQGMPVILPTRAAWAELVDRVPPIADRLADAFWPGPLTIAVWAKASVDPRVSLDGRVGVRLPGPCAAADLVRAYGRPLTATSANLPGAPPATTADAVTAAFGQTVHVVAGQAPGGAPSTVVVVDGEGYTIARLGRIDAGRLAAALVLDPPQRKG